MCGRDLLKLIPIVEHWHSFCFAILHREQNKLKFWHFLCSFYFLSLHITSSRKSTAPGYLRNHHRKNPPSKQPWKCTPQRKISNPISRNFSLTPPFLRERKMKSFPPNFHQSAGGEKFGTKIIPTSVPVWFSSRFAKFQKIFHLLEQTQSLAHNPHQNSTVPEHRQAFADSRNTRVSGIPNFHRRWPFSSHDDDDDDQCTHSFLQLLLACSEQTLQSSTDRDRQVEAAKVNDEQGKEFRSLSSSQKDTIRPDKRRNENGKTHEHRRTALQSVGFQKVAKWGEPTRKHEWRCWGEPWKAWKCAW